MVGVKIGETVITKCRFCGKNDLRVYMKSCDDYEYFRKCKGCGVLTYKKFPSYIPQEQHQKYVGVLNEM